MGKIIHPTPIAYRDIDLSWMVGRSVSAVSEGASGRLAGAVSPMLSSIGRRGPNADGHAVLKLELEEVN